MPAELTPDARSVGFIGLGDQGGPMALKIAEAGFDLVVWARRQRSLEVLADVPHTVCATVAELGERCELIGLCLRDDDDIEEVVFKRGLLAAMKPRAILANHGTGSPDACTAWFKRCAEFGVEMLDAPVSGGRVAALDGTLTTMVGGSREAAEHCRPVFASFSRLISYLGAPGSGQLAKLMNNTLMGANLKNAEEIVALGDALGFDPEGLSEVLLESSGASFALKALTKLMPPNLVEHYTAMIGKDVRHFSAAARARGIPESPIEESARVGVSAIGTTVERLYRDGEPA